VSDAGIAGSAGIGNVPFLASIQGYNGGIGFYASPNFLGGGGGGAGAVGGNATSTVGGTGGAGRSATVAGASVVYSGGGGGGRNTTGGGRAAGGTGGGGGGGYGSLSGVNGTVNLGGGGGGGGLLSLGGNGGSGVVKIWYASPSRATITGTGNTTAPSGAFTVHTFINSGTITFTS
jgi:hypothetical protein